jgi:hypothetical protein
MKNISVMIVALLLSIASAGAAETPSLEAGSRDAPKDGKCTPGAFECGYRQNCKMENDKVCLGCLQDYKFGGPTGCYRCSQGTSIEYVDGQWICK